MEPEKNTTSQFSPQANSSLNNTVESADNSGFSQAGDGLSLTGIFGPQSNIDSTKVNEKPPMKLKITRRMVTTILLIVLALLAFCIIGFVVWRLYIVGGLASEKTKTNDKYNTQSLTIDGTNKVTSITPSSLTASQQVNINGSLQVSGSLRLVPTSRPANPIPGQQYIDETDNKLYLYNGSDWIAQLNVVDLNAINASVQNLQVQNASISNLINSNETAIANNIIPENLTTQGNIFNGASQLVQLTAGGIMPVLNGANLTNVDATSLQGNGASYYTNASNLSSGTLADGRLSSNVAVLNAANQTFTGNMTVNGTVTTNTIQPTTALSLGLISNTLSLQGNSSSSVVIGDGGFITTLSFGGVASGNVIYSFDRGAAAGAYQVCTTVGNCLGGGGGGANTSLSNLASTAINQNLLPGAAGAVNLGSNTLPFGQLSFSGSAATPASQNFTLTGSPTAQRVITIPDASDTICMMTLQNCLGGSGGGANTALSNLSPTAINQSLLPGSAGSINLGSTSLPFGQLALAGTSASPATNNFLLSGASTGGTRTLTLPDGSGTVAVGPLTTSGLLYGNGAGQTIGSVANGTTGQCLIAQTGSPPTFGSCSGAGSGSSLQAAYDNGNTITSTNNRDVAITLADTTTDSNMTVNIASGSTSKFAVQNAGTDLLSVTTAAGIIANTDLTITGKANAIDSNFVQHTATTQLGKPSIKTGTYNGNYAGTFESGTCSGASGANTQTVSLGSGWGKANLVFIQATTDPDIGPSPVAPPYARYDGNRPVFKMEGVLANSARSFAGYGDDNVDLIRDISVTDQMTVGCLLNKSGITYSYVAVHTESGSADDYFAFGSYTGDGSSGHNISLPSGKTWSPDMVLLFEQAAVAGDQSRVPYWRSSDMPAGQALHFSSTAGVGNHITGFGNGYFTVGSSGNTNESGATYRYIAFKKLANEIDTTGYVGDGTSNRNLPISSNFQPDMSWVKADYYTDANNFQSVHRTSAFAANNSQTLNGGFGSGAINNFYASGLVIGNGVSSNWVNGTGINNYSFNLKSQTWLSNVGGYGPSAVYRGRLFASTRFTDFGQIYAYTSGDNFTEASSSAGKIKSDDPGNIDGVGDMKVYDDKLIAGSLTGSGGNSAGLYSYDGTSWTKLNSSHGSFGSTTNIDDVESVAVVGGQVYIGTGETDGAEVYRYNGGSSFTKISDATAGKVVTGDTADIDSIKLVNFQGRLYAGSKTGSAGTSAVYVYDGSSWAKVNGTSGAFGTNTLIDNVDAMTVYNGALIVSTSKNSGSNGEIYRLSAPTGGAVGGSFVKISYGIGQIMSGGSSTVTTIPSLSVYQGYLLAGVSDAGKGAIYRYDGNDASLSNNWGLLCTNGGNCPAGTMGGDSGIDAVISMVTYNGDLFAGSSKSNGAHLYSFHRNDSTSYGLKFIGSTSGGFDNVGTFSFSSGSESRGNDANTGQFLLSHTLTTSAGAYDIAEDYQTSDDNLQPGDVVAIDPTRVSGFVRQADLGRGDGSRLLGIVSTHPAFRLSQKENYNSAAGSRTVPVALAGRVPVKVDPASESIAPGDYLTASSTPGMATKTTQASAVVAKALEGWQKGNGKLEIEVFVSNTFLLPGNQSPASQSISPIVEQIISSGKPVTIFDAFLATAGNSLQVLKDLNIFGNAFFKSNVDFAGRLTYHDKDSAGHATLYKGQQKVEVKFDKPYEETPIISVTPLNYIRFKITDKTKDGFTIQVQDEVQSKVEFDWTAVNLVDPKTFENLIPAASEGVN